MQYTTPLGTPILRAGIDVEDLEAVTAAALRSTGTDGPAVLVTSPSVGAITPILEAVTAACAEVTGAVPQLFSHVRPGAPRSGVDAVIDLVRASGATRLVSFGGASSIDTAKATVAALLPSPDDHGEGCPALAHIAIPSTLGGAEFTPFAGVTEPDGKRAVMDPRITPDTVVHATALLASLPPLQLRHTVANAMSHCLEGIRSTRATPVTLALQLWGLHGLATAALCEGGAEHSDLRKLQDSAAAAGMVPVPMGPAHAAVHALTNVCDMPHGIAHGILGAAGVRTIQERAWPEKDPLGADLETALPGTGSVFERLTRINAHLGIPTTLHEAGVTRAQIELAMEEFDNGPDQHDSGRAASARHLLDAAW